MYTASIMAPGGWKNKWSHAELGVSKAPPFREKSEGHISKS